MARVTSTTGIFNELKCNSLEDFVTIIKDKADDYKLKAPEGNCS